MIEPPPLQLSSVVRKTMPTLVSIAKKNRIFFDFFDNEFLD